MTIDPGSRFQKVELVLAISAVSGATVACAQHGDLAMVRQLASYYQLAADSVRDAGGRVVKVIGDGILFTFSPSRAHDAISALRTFQHAGTKGWHQFDERCRIQIKVGIGSVLAGRLGPPADERDDIFGDALNRLFKMPVDDFVLSPELSDRLSEPPA